MATLGVKRGREKRGEGSKTPTKSLEHWMDFERDTERVTIGVAKSWRHSVMEIQNGYCAIFSLKSGCVQ